MFYYLQEMHFRARFEGKYHWVCLSGAKVATKAPVLGSCVIFLTQAHSFLQYTCSCRSFRKKWVLIPTQVHACNFTAICSCHSNANVCSGFSLQSRKSSKVGQGCFWIPKLKLSPLYMNQSNLIKSVTKKLDASFKQHETREMNESMTNSSSSVGLMISKMV